MKINQLPVWATKMAKIYPMPRKVELPQLTYVPWDHLKLLSRGTSAIVYYVDSRNYINPVDISLSMIAGISEDIISLINGHWHWELKEKDYGHITGIRYCVE